jgi:hypothetical protein
MPGIYKSPGTSVKNFFSPGLISPNINGQQQHENDCKKRVDNVAGFQELKIRKEPNEEF